MKRAFTLIELMIVILIIVLLLSISVSVISKSRSVAILQDCHYNMRSFSQLINVYQIDHKEWPSSNLKGWASLYLDGIPDFHIRVRPWMCKNPLVLPEMVSGIGYWYALEDWARVSDYDVSNNPIIGEYFKHSGFSGYEGWIDGSIKKSNDS